MGRRLVQDPYAVSVRSKVHFIVIMRCRSKDHQGQQQLEYQYEHSPYLELRSETLTTSSDDLHITTRISIFRTSSKSEESSLVRPKHSTNQNTPLPNQIRLEIISTNQRSGRPGVQSVLQNPYSSHLCEEVVTSDVDKDVHRLA